MSYQHAIYVFNAAVDVYVRVICSYFDSHTTDLIYIPCSYAYTLRWRHNGRDSVSNHQPHDCLLNRLFRRRSKKTSKLRVTGLCAGNSPETGEFPAQMASNAENVSIWWRPHVVTSHVRSQDKVMCTQISHKYHGCWCFGSLRRQRISSHNIDTAPLKDLSTRRVYIEVFDFQCARKHMYLWVWSPHHAEFTSHKCNSTPQLPKPRCSHNGHLHLLTLVPITVTFIM